jgi:spore coat polysaccharide biosynthesis protein SpsF
MKLGYVILCRYGSTRLPGKILASLGGKPILSYIYERVCCASERDPVVVAMSLDSSDDPIAQHCVRANIPFYRGSLDNVADRFLSCASVNGFDYAVRINGDNLFASPAIMSCAAGLARDGHYDFITNVKGRTYPTGMSVEIVNVPFYASAIQAFSSAAHFEHVTLYLYENEHIGRRFHMENNWCPEARGTHMAIDSAQDLEAARRLLEQTGGAHLNYDLPQWHRMMTGASS